MVSTTAPLQGPFTSGQRVVGTPSHYGPPEGYRLTLVEVTKALGVSIYRLSKMIGVPPTNNGTAYRWLKGDLRPSGKYLNRIILLLVLKQNHGWSTDRLSNIDWETFGNAKG